VAAGLETPGLLAVLSRDAAGMIGIRSRSIGRIRMTQPSDPVAFSRFTEGLGSSGDPDYDPRSLVRADPLAQTYVQSVPDSGIPASPEVSGDPGESGFSLSPEPPAAISGEGDSGPWYEEIVDLPDPEGLPGASEPDEGIVRESSPEPVYAGAEEELPAERAPEEDEIIELADPWEDRFAGGTAPETGEPDTPETSLPPDRGTEPVIAVEPEAPPAEPVPGTAEDYELSLIPAEEQPPEEAPRYEIPPKLVIEPIPEGGVPEQAAGPEPVMDESQFVAPLEAPPAAAVLPAAPSPAAIAPPPSLGEIFSVPLISSLEQGKYYLQIGAFSRTEAVESLISKVGNGYPLAVQNGGTGEKPLYRLLIGPVNLGESGALLQRFKSIGYRDVFVRKGS
jgi:cell division septation protein DedD